MLTFPTIDPVLIEIGPVALRWYSLAYITGFLLGWWWIRRLIQREPGILTREQLDDLLFWAVLGVVLGGRLGYVLFYNAPHYLEHPGAIFAVWEGGMSFHGGMLGLMAAVWWFARARECSFLRIMDLIAAAGPIGLFLGRLANFINGELYGRVTNSPLGMVFPNGGPEPRHPSQLYEAVLEGFVLFFVLWALIRYADALKKPGLIGGSFLAGYGLARFSVEFFREPDAHLGFLFAGATMGQLLSLPMIALGGWLVWRATRQKQAPL